MRRTASGSKRTRPRQAAVRHSPPASPSAAGGRDHNASRSSAEETARSSTTGWADDAGAASAEAGGAGGGSGANAPTAGRGGPSNGRVSKCRVAISIFSRSVYGGNSTTIRRSRIASGTAPASIAVTIQRTPERSRSTPRCASRKAARRRTSNRPSTASTPSSSSAATRSTPSKMKTGLFTAASPRPSTTRPGPRHFDPRMNRPGGFASSDAVTQLRPRAPATARANDVFPIPGGPAKQRTDARGPAGRGRTTSAGHAPVSAGGRGHGPSKVSRSRDSGHAARNRTTSRLTPSRAAWPASSARAT